METWYRASSLWKMSIETVEITRTSESSVWVNSPNWGESRRNIKSEHDCYYRTIEEAKQHYIDLAQKEVDRMVVFLKNAEDNLAKAKAL